MVIADTTVVPTFWVSVSTGSNTTVTKDFYYNMWGSPLNAYIVNEVASSTWSSNWCSVSKITRIWTAKLKWWNKQKLRPRWVVWIWKLWRWTFYWLHSDWTYMSNFTGIAASSSANAGTITPQNFVWYLTIDFNDQTYLLPYYTSK